MKTTTKARALLIAAATAPMILLSACGGDDGKDAVMAAAREAAEKDMCWTANGNPVLGFQYRSFGPDHTLQAMVDAGYFTWRRGTVMYTHEGLDAKVWDEEKGGFCLGTPAISYVGDMERDGQRGHTVKVSVVDRPEWARVPQLAPIYERLETRYVVMTQEAKVNGEVTHVIDGVVLASMSPLALSE